MIEKPKIEDIDNINQLKNKVNSLNKLINRYTLLKGDTNNISEKKSIEFFVSHMVKNKLNIQELIDEIIN